MNKIEIFIYILVAIQLVTAKPLTSNEQHEECQRLMDNRLSAGLDILYDSASSNEQHILHNKKLKDCFESLMDKISLDPEQEGDDGYYEASSESEEYSSSSSESLI
jgi:hypothetical protein